MSKHQLQIAARIEQTPHHIFGHTERYCHIFGTVAIQPSLLLHWSIKSHKRLFLKNKTITTSYHNYVWKQRSLHRKILNVRVIANKQPCKSWPSYYFQVRNTKNWIQERKEISGKNTRSNSSMEKDVKWILRFVHGTLFCPTHLTATCDCHIPWRMVFLWN